MRKITIKKKHNRVHFYVKAIVAVSIILIVFISLFLFFIRYTDKTYYPIKFEKIEEFESHEPLYQDEKKYWLSVRHRRFDAYIEYSGNPFKEQEAHIGYKGIYYNNVDFDKYTYILTLGHELSEISYSYSSMQFKKWFLFPKEFVGKVKLKKEFQEQKIFLYRIKIMDIDNSWNIENQDVEFVD